LYNGAEESNTVRTILSFALLASSAIYAASPIADIYDGDVKSVEREILGLAQKMPADKYDYAPTNGTFTGVRTFGMQVKHIATVMYQISASVLNEKAPVDLGPTDNGPESLKTKDQILDYFKGSIAYAHKAMSTLTEKNMLDKVHGAFGPGMSTRLESASILGWHSYDHYGQMVVYARANNVVPGNAPPPPPVKK
jgi:DinB superfamily